MYVPVLEVAVVQPVNRATVLINKPNAANNLILFRYSSHIIVLPV